MTIAFLHGLTLAFGLILPLGVQNFFIFSQGAMTKRFINIIPVVITAALCDTLLILLAVLGVSVLVLSFTWIKSIFVISGVIFLIYMGIQTWKSKMESNENIGTSQLSKGRLISFTAMISLLNPHAILDTIGVIGSSSLAYQGYDKFVFTMTCILVSWIWFFMLAISGKALGLRDKSGRLIHSLNKISAVVMWVAAIYLIYSM